MPSSNTTTADAAKPSGSSQLFSLPAWHPQASSAPSEASKMEYTELTNKEALTSASAAGAKNRAEKEPCFPGRHWPKCFYCWRRTLNYGSCDECAGGRASATAARSLKGGGFVQSTGREGLMTLLECRRAAVARARPAIRPVESAPAAIGFATLTRSGSSNRIA